MRDVVVLDVGMTAFGKFPDRTLKDLGFEAVWAALRAADVRPSEIGAAYCGNAVAGPLTGQTMCLGQIVLKEAGITGIPIVNVENACASGSTAFREAWIGVASGLYDVALAVGVEKLYIGDTARTTAAIAGASDTDIEGRLGLTMTGMWAMRARRYMEQYGVTPAQLAAIAVKAHDHGSLNPRAQFRNRVSVDDVLASAKIADPLTLLQCSPIGDGASAAILCTPEFARRHTGTPIRIAAAALTSGTYDTMRDITFDELERRAAGHAWTMAGLGPDDIDVAEVHDCFTIAECCRVESLGLVKEGRYAHEVEAGVTRLGGRMPVNPSGGLLSKGHPIGATGIAQIAEIVWQLRGQAGDRQAGTPRVGLAHCSGGGVAGDNACCTVHVLCR